MGKGKIDSLSFFCKGRKVTKFVLLLWGSQVIGLELVSYSEFCFSRPDLDGNKPAKGKCLERKARDREVF